MEERRYTQRVLMRTNTNHLCSLIMLSFNSLALHGHLEIVKLLTERSEKDTQDMKDTCGTTALMDAIRAGHVSIARYLVDAKVSSFECRDGLGRTPIHLAAQVLEVYHLLVFSHVKICSSTNAGWLYSIYRFSS